MKGKTKRILFDAIVSANSMAYLMTGCSKKNGENHLRKCFRRKETETRIKFNPRLVVIGFRKTGPWLYDFKHYEL